MARFDKLEFNAPSPSTGEPAVSKRSDVDEAHWMQQGDANRRQGLYENALKYYSRALENDKSLVAGWLGQVQMLILLGEAKEAEVWSRKALELFPSNGDLMAGRAQACCRMGNGRQAYALSDGAIAQQGLSAYRWMVRGEVMLGGRSEVEEHCFDKAQQLDGDWLIPLEIALIYLHYRRPSKALSRVRRAVDAAPDCFYAWYVQGLCQMRMGLDRQARQCFERCLDLCPRHADSLSRLAELDQQSWSPARLWRRLLGKG
jgi:tetratricopeptide (TPR) repeat protein